MPRGTVKLRIVKDSDWGEYIVKYYKDGKYDLDKSYFTGDYIDALHTSEAMALEALGQGNTVLPIVDRVVRSK